MNKDRFELTNDHLKLIQEMNIGYNEGCEFGAPNVDPKRPYGNSDVYNDIGEILGIKPEQEDDWGNEFSNDQIDYMNKIHRQTAKALQVILSSKSFSTGFYEADMYRDNWQPI